MNRYTLLYYSVFALMLLTTSCKDGNAFGDGFLPSLTLEENEPSPVNPTPETYVTPEVTSVSFSSEAASQTISVRANIRYFFECKSDWLTVSPTNNEYIYQALTITVDENTTSEERKTEITLFIQNGDLTRTTMTTITVTQAAIDKKVSPIIRSYAATTLGSSAHFQDLSSTSTDIITISVNTSDASLYDIEYRSDFWGYVTFTNVEATNDDNIYHFSETSGIISMPTRRPGIEEVAYKDYPAILKQSFVELSQAEIESFSFTIEADLGETAGIYTLVFSFSQKSNEPDPLGLCPDNNHPHLIDMGLSVKWACCNVGASSPVEYGGYFAWGETAEKSIYDWSTYKLCNGTDNTMTKYCTDSNYGTVDSKTQLELSDDAARVKWGSPYRMPTIDELNELNDNCTWTWTSISGVDGYTITSKSKGNNIFLPATGYRNNGELKNAGSYGNYLSSSLSTTDARRIRYLYFHISGHGTDYYYRYYGRSVRPVSTEIR